MRLKKLSRWYRRYGLAAALLFAAVASFVLLLGSSLLLAHEGGLIVVAEDQSRVQLAESLEKQGVVGSKLAFLALYTVRYGFGVVAPGGYEVSKDMSLWQVIQILRKPPYLRWVTLKEGMRKEEVAVILTEKLDWSSEKSGEFMRSHLSLGLDAREGRFYPDTYLLPTREGGEQIAKRLLTRFDEKVGPLFPLMMKENIKHDTALKLASIIQREAAGPEDMPLVAGILWNRLTKGMKLEVDATVQYARGDVGKGYWAPIIPKDKGMYSPYNTYRYYGLPPTPIANPGLNALVSAVKPTKTDCLYYIHDSNRRIHCAKTYAEHKRNISKYL